MFVSHVSNSRFPFCNGESFKMQDNGLCATLQMLADTFNQSLRASHPFSLPALIINYDKMTSGI